MKKILLSGGVIAAIVLATWLGVNCARTWRYAHQPYEVEEFDAPTFTVEIPKGWERPDYLDPREGTRDFMTGASTATIDESDPYFIKGNLSINDEGKNASVEKVIAEWRKDGTAGPIRRVKIGNVEAQTWTDVVGFIDIAGRMRTYVFTGPNGHTYSASYLCAIGDFGERQEYVFSRILASLKFHEDRDLGGPARKKKS